MTVPAVDIVQCGCFCASLGVSSITPVAFVHHFRAVKAKISDIIFPSGLSGVVTFFYLQLELMG